MWFKMENENVLYERVLTGHIGGMIGRLKGLPEDKWDWTPHVAAATARTLAAHAYQWLVCDRQHIEEPDASKHVDVPEPQGDPASMIAALEQEKEAWSTMLLQLTAEDFDRPLRQFGVYDEGNVRGFIGHVIQNTIYKHGQLSTLYFALELDGSEPYKAPFPNPIYADVRAGVTA